MSQSGKARDIKPANGKLGVLLPGMGAVATTFVAGVEAARKGLARPIGSLTQMGTVRLGKRTDNRSPLIKDFVPLARLEDVEFGGWDVYPDSAYEAARKAGVLEERDLGPMRAFLEGVYRGLAEDPHLACAAIGRVAETSTARGELKRLHSGSWIEASYRIWIGGSVENRAWTLLGEARAAVERARKAGKPIEAALAELYVAEGSDWFWWYGDDFASDQKELFDVGRRLGAPRAVLGVALGVARDKRGRKREKCEQ